MYVNLVHVFYFSIRLILMLSAQALKNHTLCSRSWIQEPRAMHDSYEQCYQGNNKRQADDFLSKLNQLFCLFRL